MAILKFEHITEASSIGEKGKNLGLMSSWGLPVPDGMVLTSLPSLEEWQSILIWWKEHDYHALAVRSSACGEDSAEFSFAGQNKSFLNVKDENQLKKSIEDCFASVYGDSSIAYREHFIGGKSKIEMNVVLQLMVEPKFSGVFFSKDPRGINNSWLLEVVEGLGEALVSGQVTPKKITENEKDFFEGWEESFSQNISHAGIKLRQQIGAEIDMEWAIDHFGHFHALQVRPVTAMGENTKELLETELRRLKKHNPEGAVWDGQSFAEVPGLPTPLTFSVWKSAFAPGKSFHKALVELGYLGFVDEDFSPHDSVFESVFGRGYINLEKMNRIFFGPIPYRLDPLPSPHLVFDAKKIDSTTIFRTPVSLYHMIKVAFEVSSNRKKWISKIEKDLLQFQEKMQRPETGDLYKNWDIEKVRDRLSKEVQIFSEYSLTNTFVLILLIQATMESLKKVLLSIFSDKEKADRTFNLWLAKGLKTVTSEMGLYYIKACEDSTKIPFYLSRYGHRAPGELELQNPRFSELADKAFKSTGGSSYEDHKSKKQFDINTEIESIKSFKKILIKEEWDILKSLLQLREKLKLEILRPYAHIRYLALALGEKTGLGDGVFWLHAHELCEAHFDKDIELLKSVASKRKAQHKAFATLSLPLILSLDEIGNVVEGDSKDSDGILVGDPISPGVAKGIVKVIHDVKEIDFANLPQDLIIVTEATDPGWTPIFTKARGIIVEKGGVLSHCAIVAREMNIPAVSQVMGCYKKLKDGDVVWLDGNNGRIIIK